MLKIFARLPEVCRRVLFKIIKMTVHEWRSILLRRLWQASYGVEIGIGSYGCFHRGAFCPGDRIYDGVGPEQVVWESFLPVNVPGLSELAYATPWYWEGEYSHWEAGRE